MTRWFKFILVTLVVCFALIVSTPTTYAGRCTPYQHDWLMVGDDPNDFFVDSNEYANVIVADLRSDISCGFWIKFRTDYIVFVNADITENGKTRKGIVQYTQDMGKAWFTDYARLVYRMRIDAIKTDKKYYTKRTENSWEWTYSKPAVVYSIANCKVEDLVSGKILLSDDDGFFISKHFVVTELTNTNTIK